MNEKSHLNHLLLLIVGTIFISTSGALGKYIDLPTPVIIWWRSVLAAFFLLIFCLYKGINLKIKNRKDRQTFFIAALLMASALDYIFLCLKII